MAQSFVFGFNQHVTTNAHFMDEDTIVYTAGYNVILYNRTDKTQRFIHTTRGASDTLEGYTSIGISPSKRFLAVAEKADQPEIFIFDMKSTRKRKGLTYEEATQPCSFINVAFSHDNEKIIALVTCSLPSCSLSPPSFPLPRPASSLTLSPAFLPERGSGLDCHRMALEQREETVSPAGVRGHRPAPNDLLEPA